MKVFVVNAGSSSLKFQVFEMPKEEVLVSGLVERIGEKESFIEIKLNGQKIRKDVYLKTHLEGVEAAVEFLIVNGVIKNKKEIEAVGHRVVFGGAKNTQTKKIDAEILSQEKELSKVAPLHIPGSFMGIRACTETFGKENYAVFDTAFHRDIPEKAYMYPIKYEDYENLGYRKYGYHGISHQYVSEIAITKYGGKKIISCHLGSGASIAAIDNGKCVETSMGYTPLDGLIMGTRTGAIDASVALNLMRAKGMTVDEVLNYLNKECGLKGIFGKNDFRDIEAAMETDKKARLAQDMFCYRVAQFIGSYAASMNGVDTIVFTAGVGERGIMQRTEIAKYLGFLGAYMNEEANKACFAKEGIISTKDSKVQMLVIPTNEELVIAREVYRLKK